MKVYYNDIEPFVCDWLRELMRDGLIAEGDIDSRSITDIDPADLKGYTRCHFFAGIGGWELALNWAGWPDDAEVWTGSCPCQPFSSAGKRKGTDDDRHLWPAFRELIAERRPPTVFGEQVASSDGRAWLASVFADLEDMDYRAAGADLCAAGVGAPHIRQRLWWCADTNGVRLQWVGSPTERPWSRKQLERLVQAEAQLSVPSRASGALVDGISNRVGILRGAGNAIVPQVAAEFVMAYMEAR